MNAIVTGARKGIGRATVLKLIQNGINVWATTSHMDDAFVEDMWEVRMTAYVNNGGLLPGEEELPFYDDKINGIGWICPIEMDLSSEDSIKAAVKEIMSERNPSGEKLSIDILINNAGVPGGGLMQMTSLDKLRDVMEVNFIGQISLIQKVSKMMTRQYLSYMKKNARSVESRTEIKNEIKNEIFKNVTNDETENDTRYDVEALEYNKMIEKNAPHFSIVNVGSVGGIEAREGYLSYGSSKAAFMWATRCISKELAPYNIRVNAVAPGLVDTDMGDFKTDEEQEKILNAISMKRKGDPEEIAEVIYFLATDASSFITGSIINADGGRLI